MQVSDTRKAEHKADGLAEALAALPSVGGKPVKAVLATTIKGLDRIVIRRYTPRTQQGGEGKLESP